ncbi:MAG: xanthine dehydrogenase family protein, partial [Hyphomicrobiaceae bacterium]|nr:xanthine dehydrogenase family protein [Hyphomicrobiaceae bacterium]
DAMAEGLGRLPGPGGSPSKGGPRPVAPSQPLLAQGRVRYLGEPVAFVVAESGSAAHDAAELIEIAYEPLPCVTGTAAAVEPGAPRLWDEAPGNVSLHWEMGDRDACARAFDSAAQVTRLELVNNRVAAYPLEPTTVLADYHPGDGHYTLYTASQGVFSLRETLAKDVLRVPEGALRVVTPDVGGSFGIKLVAYPEQVAVLAAARLVGRPVRWAATRGESMLSDTHARDHVSEATLALDEEGRFLGLELLTHGNLGAYTSAFAALTVSVGFSKTVGGVYRIPALALTSRAVYTNTAPTDACRGAGKPESLYLMERLVDKAAAETGIDRFELRRRNLVAPVDMPYTAATGIVWKDADFPAVLERALDESDWPGFAARRTQSAAAGRLRGYGLGMYLHISGGVPEDTATVELEADGIVAIRTGAQDIGQGLETSFTRIVAGKLGIDVDRVRLRQGDSEDMPARTTATGGSSALQIAGI